MGLLDKLFEGNKDLEKAAKGLLNGLLNAAEKKEESAGSAAPGAQPQQRVDEEDDGPSGFSWGDKKPDEENQYNYDGPFWVYFENIFRSEFATTPFTKDQISSNRIAYTFYSGASKVLVVELMSENCSAYKLRNDTKKEGVPYTRFYIDHYGWWNTKKYVITRMREAMKG